MRAVVVALGVLVLGVPARGEAPVRLLTNLGLGTPDGLTVSANVRVGGVAEMGLGIGLPARVLVRGALRWPLAETGWAFGADGMLSLVTIEEVHFRMAEGAAFVELPAPFLAWCSPAVEPSLRVRGGVAFAYADERPPLGGTDGWIPVVGVEAVFAGK